MPPSFVIRLSSPSPRIASTLLTWSKTSCEMTQSNSASSYPVARILAVFTSAERNAFRSKSRAISTAWDDTSNPLTEKPFAANFVVYTPQPQPASQTLVTPCLRRIAIVSSSCMSKVCMYSAIRLTSILSQEVFQKSLMLIAFSPLNCDHATIGQTLIDHFKFSMMNV